MASLTEYYNRTRGSLMNISPKEAVEFAEETAAAAAGGAVVGFFAAHGKTDLKIGQFTLPLDGMAASAVGVAGLAARGQTGRYLKCASQGMVGAVAARISAQMFKAATSAHGELDEGVMSGLGNIGMGSEYGEDRLLRAARML